MTTIGVSRLDRLRRHLEGGGNVCPFTRLPDHTYVNDEALTHRTDDSHPFRVFARKPRSNRAFLVVARNDPKTITGLRTWANRRFLWLATEGTLIGTPDVTRREAYLVTQKVVAPSLRPSAKNRVFVNIGPEPITATALAPIYPVAHPRYAPVTCLSLVWFFDIVAVKHQPFVDKIRDVMLSTHGEIYDADELVLPLPQEIPS